MPYPEEAQRAIESIIATHQRDGDIDTTFEIALASLVTGMRLDRAVFWQPIYDRLVATIERSSSPDLASCSGEELNSQEATQIVLEFLIQSESELKNGNTVVAQSNSIPVELAPWARSSRDFASSLLIPLGTRGLLRGFLALQSQASREWSNSDHESGTAVAALLAILEYDAFEIARQKTEISAHKSSLEIISLFTRNAMR